MGRTLSDEAIRIMGLFESITGVEAVDCLVQTDHDRVVLVVPAGEMATAIGPGGETVSAVEERLNRDVTLVEMADRAGDLVANALRPAAVYGVDVEDGVARVDVAEEDRGVAIGRDGRTVELARTLGSRHFDLADVELTSPEGDV